MNTNHTHAQRLGLSLLLLLGVATPALAQGTVVIREPVPHPRRPNRVTTMPLELQYQRVYVEITDGVAVTEVQQTFRNPLRRQIEGTYVFPLPDDVAVGDFEMTVAGKTLKGEVLEKEQARRTYEEIVRRVRDPGLLEFLGKRLYQASIFPIPPGEQLEIKLRYSQTIREQGGLGQFAHPLRGQSQTAGVIAKLVVQVKLRSTLPLTSVFCPSHKCDISRPNDHDATVTYEGAHIRPDRDFNLYYQRQDTQFGLSLLTHRGAGEAGYFLLRLSPRIEISPDQILPKNIAFVIDTSGSMQGGKLEQVRRSLEFCINTLDERDRFNIYSFATSVHPFREGLVPATGEIKAAAIDFTRKMEAIGGTNINQALLSVLDVPRDGTRPYLVVFMTDGEPTVDVTDPNKILKNVAEKNTHKVRFHVLGVGTEVNTHLLDKLAEQNHGTRAYCTENEELELKLSAFVSRLANPVLTDITLEIDGLQVVDLYPQWIPDLFCGNDIMLLGRYHGDGHKAVRVQGRLHDAVKTFTYESEFPRINPHNDFLPRLWANRKVAYLLDQIRLHGHNRELVDEVVRLATRFGIVTPYTSALILEDSPRIAAGAPVLRDAIRRSAARVGRSSGGRAGGFGAGRGMAPARGTKAVAQSEELRELGSLGYIADDTVSLDLDWNGAGQRTPAAIRHVGDKTFVFDDGRYIDSTWDAKVKPKIITAYSDEYFALLKKHPLLARFLAIGERILVVFQGHAYEIVPKE